MKEYIKQPATKIYTVDFIIRYLFETFVIFRIIASFIIYEILAKHTFFLRCV